MKNACAATLQHRAEVEIFVRFAVGERWGVVEVADSAGGIPPALAVRIWKFGWTTHRYDEGHLAGFGVGLPISKVFMDMWAGAIDVYSVWGKGTTVRVYFPKSPTEVLLSNSRLRPD
ncbi:unnamed protein product [Phytomonas sp. Hart1]|nr:unnamed protein product [Phytomonas sp. Hart1]|eukprot:CCW67178.1 unnamed protein product [Phytomonas sp. isolate Hart1]